MATLPKQHNRKAIYYLLFTLSGFSGLIYESIWSHYLKLFLGHSAYAQTLVLVIFMGGLAVGSWTASRFGPRRGNLLLGYAIIEFTIGLLALGFHPAFLQVDSFTYRFIIPLFNTPLTINAVKFTIASFLILPQSILLGATFPLMSTGLIRRFPEKPGNTLAFLYFTNSIGAAAGVLSSGFFLISRVGLPGTILSAGLVNCIVAVVVWLLCHDAPAIHVAVPKSTAINDAARRQTIFLFVAAATGAASFCYEIAWVRMLSLVLGSSTHAFELMLSAFILGLALGGYWIRKRIDSLQDPVRALGWIQLIMGILALLTLFSYGLSFNLMAIIVKGLAKTENNYLFFNLLSHAVTLAIMLPATFCAGMTLPILTFLLLSDGYGERSIGNVYAANTLGSILGIVLSVHLIMPAFGLKNVILIGCGIDIIAGLFLLRLSPPGGIKERWQMITAISVIAWLTSLLTVHFDPLKLISAVYLTGKSSQTAEVLFHQDGKTASVDLFRASGVLTISTNGKPDAGLGEKEPTQDDLTTILLAALPLSMLQDTGKVAVVGLGSGMTTHALLTVPGINQVDTIEIEPAMVAAAKGFGERVANTFNDHRSRIHIEDAKVYFANQQENYDLIISEPSNPWVSGIASVFSDEFYHRTRNYLNTGGLFAQWFHLYQINIDLVASVMKALTRNFADYAIYFTVEGDLIVVAAKDGKVPLPGNFLFDLPKMSALLQRVGIDDVTDFHLRHLGSKTMLDPLFNTYPAPANSDYFPILDQGAARARFMNSDALELHRLRFAPVPLLPVPEDLPTAGSPLLPPPDASFSFTEQKAREAKQILRAFETVNTGQVESLPADDSITRLVNTVKGVLSSPPIGEYDDRWLPALKKLARATLPFLAPAELKIIWQAINASKSMNQIPPVARDWLDLYQSLTWRDYPTIRKYALLLLPAGRIATNTDNNELMLAAMFVMLNQNDRQAATELWSRYDGRENPVIELRLVAALIFSDKLQENAQPPSRPEEHHSI